MELVLAKLARQCARQLAAELAELANGEPVLNLNHELGVAAPAALQ